MHDESHQLVFGFVDRFVAAGEYARAQDALKLALRQFPDDTAFLARLGECFLEDGRGEEAFETFNRVLDLSPGHVGALAALKRLSDRVREIASSTLTFGHGRKGYFNVHRLLTGDMTDDHRLWQALGERLLAEDGLALYGPGWVLDRLLTHVPALSDWALALVADHETVGDHHGMEVVAPDHLPDGVETVFLCESRTWRRQEMLHRLPGHVRVIDAGILDSLEADWAKAVWGKVEAHIYPMAIPELKVEDGLDVLILDCPARNLALVPNGLGFVSNALQKTPLKFQILDADIIMYHRFQLTRLFDADGTIYLPDGTALSADPWRGENSGGWENGENLAAFTEWMDELVAEVVRARPKVLGVSIHACNIKATTWVVEKVRSQLPDTVVICGGFQCYNPSIGLRAFPITDYMCIGEADLTVGPLCEALAAGERPVDVPGVLSRFDTPGRVYTQGPMEHNLDRLGYPKYEWATLSLYRNYNGFQLTPIIASRGCRWSQCTFCAERFYWRIRSPKKFADEVEWLISQGATHFMFSESDLNGMPEKLLEICDEIIARGLNAAFIGQLRVSVKSDRAFFDKLAQAGFNLLRFGVDAFSEKTLKLQQKGYTLDTVRRNIRDCGASGIRVTLNWVVGIPGETDEDIDSGLEFLHELKDSIHMVENINPLILANGGMYWMEPERHNIRFAAPKEELYEKHPGCIPAELWWSEEPFLDADGRTGRFERAVTGLVRLGIPVSKWTERIVDDIRTGRDISRSAKRKTA